MKFTIFYQKDEGIRTSQIAPQIEYEFEDLSLPISNHITNVGLQFEQSGITVDRCQDCCLQSNKEKPIDKSASLAVQLAASETQHLTLSLHPSFKARKIINLLKDQQKIKETVFYLKTKLENIYFAEEFITAGGIPVLVDTASKATGNTQSYTLAALHAALFHLQGIRVFLDTENLIRKLYLLLESPIVSVCRQTLELLVLICTFDDKAALNINAIDDSNSESLKRLVNLVESGDLDTQINSLTLINSLLASAGTDLPNQITRINETLGLEKILRLSVAIENELFRQQLRLYEDITKVIIIEGTKPSEKKKHKEFTQPLFPLMRKEFTRAQRKMNELLRLSESLPASVQTPLKRYAQQLTQLDTNLSSAFRDEDVIQETLSELEKEVSTLQSKLKSAKSKNKRIKKSHGDDNTKKRKHKLNQSLKNSEISPRGNDENLQQQLDDLTVQFELQRKELEISRAQQQDASANVKKLAQVVKLMKSKYDNLKAQVDVPVSPQVSKKRDTGLTNDIFEDIEVSQQISCVGFSCEHFSVPIRIDTEEFISIVENSSGSVDQNVLKDLREENESLRGENRELKEKLENAASLDSLAGLMMEPIDNLTFDIEENIPSECTVFSWHQIEKSEENHSFWKSLPTLSTSSVINENLSQILLEPIELIEAIRTLDNSKLNRKQIKILATFLTSDTERITELKASNNNTEGQKLLVKLYESIPHVYERVFCWNFIQSFEDTYKQIEKRLETVVECSKDLQASTALRNCLSVVLRLGNDFLHTNSYGFYPNSLFNIVTAIDEQEELFMKRVVKLLSNNREHPIEYLSIELPNLSSASMIDLYSIFDDIQQLEMNQSRVTEFAKLFDDKIIDTVDVHGISKLSEQWTCAQTEFQEVVLYFTSDDDYAAKIPSHIFFSAFNTFVKSLNKN